MKHNKKITKQPMYLTLAGELRDGILGKRWKPGDLLPSEAQLCRDFGLSRGTVIKALEILLDEGLAQRRQGVGTFVSRPALRRMPGFLQGFSKTVRRQGRTPTHRLVDRRWLSRTEALQYGCGEPALLLHRIRLVDGVPWAIHRSLVPEAVANRVPAFAGNTQALEAPDFSLYDAFGDAGFTIDHAEETMNARLATEQEAAALATEVPSAVMLLHRKSFDPDGRLLELIEAVYLGDCYTYNTRLVRAHDIAEVTAKQAR